MGPPRHNSPIPLEWVYRLLLPFYSWVHQLRIFPSQLPVLFYYPKIFRLQLLILPMNSRLANDVVRQVLDFAP